MEQKFLKCNLDFLIKSGFSSCQIHCRQSYRGSIYSHRLIQAKKSGQSYLFFEKDTAKELTKVTEIKKIVQRIPTAAKIGDIFDLVH